MQERARANPRRFHLAFTLPAEIASIADQNKAVVGDLLFRAAAETLRTTGRCQPAGD